MPALDTIGPSIQQATINFAGAGDNTVITGAAGQLIKVVRIFFVLGGASNLTFKSGATAITGLMDFASNGAFVLDFDEVPLCCLNALDSFVINSSAGVQIGGTIWFVRS